MIKISRGVKKPLKNILSSQLTPEQISMDLKSDFMYRLEHDQELQRVSAVPVTWHTCASLSLLKKRLKALSEVCKTGFQ